MSNPKIKDPLIHNGTSQLERLLDALSKDYFKLDDRSIKDIISATYRYAKLVNYFNPDNIVQGDWTCFWEVETLTFLAVLSTIDPEETAEAFAVLVAQAKKAIDTAETNEAVEQQYLLVIEFILNQAEKIESYYHTLPEDIPFKREFLTFIKKDRITDADQLQSALKTLIGYHKEAFNQASEDHPTLSHEKYQKFFAPPWGLADEGDFYHISSSTHYRTDNWQSLTRLHKAFYRALVRIQKRAGFWFDKNLETPQLRQPHVALFLTFLRLFQHARDEMNNLTHRHLEFYYEKILHLRKRAAVSDDVHLLFELANNVDRLIVEKGTELLAGKLNGKNLIFKTIEDWVLNKAQVTEVKNTYLDLNGFLNGDNKQIYASPDVKLAYEAGAEAPNQESTIWRAFGDDADLPKGEVGFAIASPQLILREGKRVVDVLVTVDSKLFTRKDIHHLAVYLSSEEEWVELSYNSSIKFSQDDFSLNVNDPSFKSALLKETRFRIRMILERDHFPIVQLGKELAEESGFSSHWPIIKVVFNSDEHNFSFDKIYEKINEFQIKEVVIGVRVEDIRENLIIQTDQGVFDGTQKVYPFGPLPEVGDQFFIGSNEIFQKDLSMLTINFDWIDPPEYGFDTYYQNYNKDFESPSLKADFLDAGFLADKHFPNSFSEKFIDLSFSQILIKVLDEQGIGVAGVDIQISVRRLPFFQIIRLPVCTTGDDGTILIGDSPESKMATFVEVSKPQFQIWFSLDLPDECKVPSIVSYDFAVVEHVLETTINITTIQNCNFELIEEGELKREFEITDVDLLRMPQNETFDRYIPSLSRGFLRLTLNENDFLHKEYQNSLIAKTIEASAIAETKVEISKDKEITIMVDDTSINLPNPPYTPTTNGISLDYESTQIMEFGEGEIDQFFHLTPFEGHKQVKGATLPLLYNYGANDIDVDDFAAGNLYLGIENLTPGSTLSLLFQTREGTEQSFEALPPKLKWAYLTENNFWYPFEADQILKDTTYGLTRTGVVQLQLPFNMVHENSLLNDELYWIKVAAIENLATDPVESVQALPSLVNVQAQVIEARFKVDKDAPEHYVKPKPLAAKTIKKLAVSNAKIKKIEQPFPSFNGRVPEEGNEFYQRVSERLRHRDRAVVVWDYERLILEKFPKVFRAKCVRHSNLETELQPGHVLVSVIPDLRQRDLEMPLEPRFARGDLEEMEDYLRTKTNFFVARNFIDDDGSGKNDGPYLHVENAIFEPVQVAVNVLFKKGVDLVYSEIQLNKALKGFIAPWLYDKTQDISFERILNTSAILQFIESQGYVEAVLSFIVRHCDEEIDEPMVVPKTSRSVLTTAEGHSITYS